MNSVKFKVILGGLAIAAAVTYLAFSGIQSGWVYYMPVDEYLADSTRQMQRIRLHGKASEDVFASSPALSTATFDLMGETGQVAVEYHGPIPDMFVPGREVVVEGQMDDQGIFQADVLMTKCASKYQEHPGGELAEQGDESGE